MGKGGKKVAHFQKLADLCAALSMGTSAATTAAAKGGCGSENEVIVEFDADMDVHREGGFDIEGHGEGTAVASSGGVAAALARESKVDRDKTLRIKMRSRSWVEPRGPDSQAAARSTAVTTAAVSVF